jgi:hypothetical protein
MQLEELSMRKYLAELRKVEEEIIAVRQAVDLERNRLA